MHVALIIPTFNERENIRALIPALGSVTAPIHHAWEFLVVDDNSPDGTTDEVRELQLVYSPIAIEASIISNFLLNHYWTFRGRNRRDRVRVKGLKFNAVSLIALGVSYGTFVVLSWMFPSAPPQVNQLVGIAPATLVNYFLNSYWTFRHAAPARQ